LRDKDYAGMLKALAPIAKEFWLVPVSSQRGEEPEKIATLAPVASRCFTSLDDALAAARNQDSRVLVTGSLFLVGETLEVFSAA
jgi:folylpolyglutamate synthase/dihydropteroate synthase